MEIKVLIASHKDFKKPKGDFFLPIQVGKEGKEDLGFLGDNSGIHISNKNNTFCELTGLFWAWKNLDYDILGLCHYRRYFDFQKNSISDTIIIDNNELDKKEFNQKDINNILRKYDLILPKAKTYKYSLKLDYGYCCSIEDFEILTQTINRLYPEYSKSWKKISKYSNKLMHYNMFIAPKEIINPYFSWLFNILFEVEKKVKLSPYPYQQRVFGFMAERLMQLYFTHNKFKIKHLPVLFVKDDSFPYKTRSFLYTFMSNLYSNLIFTLIILPKKIKKLFKKIQY